MMNLYAYRHAQNWLCQGSSSKQQNFEELENLFFSCISLGLHLDLQHEGMLLSILSMYQLFSEEGFTVYLQYCTCAVKTSI